MQDGAVKTVRCDLNGQKKPGSLAQELDAKAAPTSLSSNGMHLSTTFGWAKKKNQANKSFFCLLTVDCLVYSLFILLSFPMEASSIIHDDTSGMPQ